MQALPGGGRDVLSPQGHRGVRHGRSKRVPQDKALGVIHRNRERQICLIIPDNIDWKLSHIFSRKNSEKVNQRRLALHCPLQTGIIRVKRIGTPIAITKEPIFSHLVFVGPGPPLNDRNRRNTYRHIRQNCWLEYSLRPDQGNPGPLEFKPLLKNFARQHIAQDTFLLFQKFRSGGAHRLIQLIAVKIFHFSQMPDIRFAQSWHNCGGLWRNWRHDRYV